MGNIRSALDQRLEKAVLDPHSAAGSGFPLSTFLNVAVEHRLMHAETLAYMLHQLPFDMKVRERESPNLAGPTVAHRMVPVPAGVVTLGLQRGSESFGWDNEFEAHEVEVPAFEIDRYKVTNRPAAMRRGLSGTTMTGTGRVVMKFFIRCSGSSKAITGFTAQCSTKCRYRWTGPCM